MCGRYEFGEDGDIDEINRIVEEISNKYAGTGIEANTGEIFPTNNAPKLSMIDDAPTLYETN